MGDKKMGTTRMAMVAGILSPRATVICAARFSCHSFFCLVCMVVSAVSAEEPASPDFNTHVLPIFQKYCSACHSEGEAEGGLVLETYDKLLAGGRRGRAVVPGRSDQSRLVLLLDGKAKPAMPPTGNDPPEAEEIAVLKAWIDGGAKSPTGAAPDPTRLDTPQVPLSAPPRLQINAAACSPDGAIFALAGYRRVRLVSAATGATVRELNEHRGNVTSVSFSADGSKLMAGCGEPGLFGEARIWNVADGALVRTIVGHRDSLYAAVLSPDGGVLATAGYDEKIKLWNVVDGAELRTIPGHNGAVYDLAFRPDGKILASASADRTVKLWNVTTGERLDTLGQSLKELYSLAFSPDGKRLAAAGVDNRIRAWQISDTGREGANPLVYARFAHQGPVIKVAFSPDGQTLASSSEDRTLKLWDSAGMTERKLLETQPDWPGALVFGRDSQSLLVGRLDGSWTIYNVASGQPMPLPEKQADANKSSSSRSFVNASRANRHIVSLLTSPGIYAWDRAPWKFRRRPLQGANPEWSRTSHLLAPEGADDVTIADEFPGINAWARENFAELALADVQAPLPAPQLTAIAPRGIQRGVTTKIKFSGMNLSGVTEIKTNQPQIAVRLLPQEANPATEVWLEATPAAGLTRGVYELSVITPGGTSGALKLHVDDLPQSVETKPNDKPATANALPLPSGVWGTFDKPGDADFFAFDAGAGQALVFDLAAVSLGSKANPVLTLLDGQGRVLVSSNDFDGQPDPLVAYTFSVGGRYTAVVSDLALGASAEHYYRLTVGAFPYVTGCFPLGVPANVRTTVELTGFNLPPDARAIVTPGPSGEAAVPVDPELFRSRRDLRVVVDAAYSVLEAEPNNLPLHATPMPAPGVAHGRMYAPRGAAADVDLFRFEAKAGQTFVIETDAARRGSPIDTKLEVLHADGRPVERLWLQAIRDSYVTFRGIDSNTVDVRLKNWEEMGLNELVYHQGEVGKIFRMPQGPDSGVNLYGFNGKRICYFDTSPTVHALEETAYIIEPHPPGTPLVPTGLPIFTLHYANDDDGERKLGADSKITFTAPADGVYLVRVSDVRGQGGDRFAYRLIVREPRPDFTVSLAGANPTIAAGSSQEITFSVDRIDGFEGEIKIDIGGLPPGYTVSSPIIVQAGHFAARAVITVAADAPAPIDANAAQSVVKATALVNGSPVVKDVNNLGKISLAPAPKLLVRLLPDPQATNAQGEIVIAPGTTVPALLRVERNGFDDRINFDVNNLPHGIIVDDIGLNGVLIPEKQTERRIFVTAAAWVPETTRPTHAVAKAEGNQASPPVILRVQRPAAIAQNPP